MKTLTLQKRPGAGRELRNVLPGLLAPLWEEVLVVYLLELGLRSRIKLFMCP